MNQMLGIGVLSPIVGLVSDNKINENNLFDDLKTYFFRSSTFVLVADGVKTFLLSLLHLYQSSMVWRPFFRSLCPTYPYFRSLKSSIEVGWQPCWSISVKGRFLCWISMALVQFGVWSYCCSFIFIIIILVCFGGWIFYSFFLVLGPFSVVLDYDPK